MRQDLREFRLLDREELVTKLITAGYAFAAWRMPNEDNFSFIVSFRGFQKLEEVDLSELSSGFLINSFQNNHPISPLFLHADLTIRPDDIKINPVVSDSQLDEFTEDLKKLSPPPVSQSATTNENKNQINQNKFTELISRAIEEIKEGFFEKVVLSRFKDESIPHNFRVWEYFELLCSRYQNAFCSLTFIPDQGLWIGASPELLISESKEGFKTVSLASTKKLEPNQSLSEIAWTQKEIEEQAFVSRYIINCFKKIRLREFHEYGPKTIKAGSLAHLKTIFEVKYDELRFEGLASQMLELLHPTSAVCGMPIENVKPWIEANENYDREFYSGFLGPVNFEDQTNLFVNLRCARIKNQLIRYYAGAGITEDSIPDLEFEETEMKIDVLRSLLKKVDKQKFT